MNNVREYSEPLFGDWNSLAFAAVAAFEASGNGLLEILQDLFTELEGHSTLHTELLRAIAADVSSILNEPFHTALGMINEARRLSADSSQAEKSIEYLKQAQFSLHRAIGMTSDLRLNSITQFFIALTWLLQGDSAGASHWREESFTVGRRWINEMVRTSNGLIIDLSDGHEETEFFKSRSPMLLSMRRRVTPLGSQRVAEIESFIRFYNMVRLSRHSSGATFRGIKFNPTYAREFGEPSHVIAMGPPLALN